MGLQQALQVGWRLCVATRSLLGESWTLENTDMACAYGISPSGAASPCTITTSRNLDLHESCQQVERIARKQMERVSSPPSSQWRIVGWSRDRQQYRICNELQQATLFLCTRPLHTLSWHCIDLFDSHRPGHLGLTRVPRTNTGLWRKAVMHIGSLHLTVHRLLLHSRHSFKSNSIVSRKLKQGKTDIHPNAPSQSQPNKSTLTPAPSFRIVMLRGTVAA